MGEKFSEVDAADFEKIREKPEYVKIEEALVQLGGGSVAGVKFKKEALKAAGWRHHELTTYAAKLDDAIKAFNNIRSALVSASSKDDVLKKLA